MCSIEVISGGQLSGPPKTLPNHVVIVDILLIILMSVLLFTTFAYKKLYLTLPHRKYPRFKVRPYYGQVLVGCSLFGSIVVISMELIGFHRINCLFSFLVVFMTVCLTQTATMRCMIYFFRVKITNLKRKYRNEEYLQRKRKWALVTRWISFFCYPFVYFVILIACLVDQQEVYFNQNCSGCEPIIPGSLFEKSIVALYAINQGVALILLLLVAHEADVFAQIPEFRLLYVFGGPSTYVFSVLQLYDVEYFGGMSSKYIFRTTWLLALATIIAFLCLVSHQYYLAGKEGQLIKPQGTDYVSQLWRWISCQSENYKKQQVQLAVVESRKENIALNKFADDPKGYKLLEEYLLGEFCVEIIQFHREVKEFKLRQKKNSEEGEDEQYKLAKKIYSTYIANGSISQINIGSDTRQRLDRFFQNNDTNKGAPVPQTIFDESDAEVMLLLNQGPYIRFQQTPAYVSFVANNSSLTSNDGNSKVAVIAPFEE